MRLSRDDIERETDHDWDNIGDEVFQDFDGNAEFGQDNFDDYIAYFEQRGREPMHRTFGYCGSYKSYPISELPKEIWDLIINAKYGE